MKKIPIPETERKWLRCPNCGAKTILYANNAISSGVFIKCTRGCKTTFEVKIKNGKQVQ